MFYFEFSLKIIHDIKIRLKIRHALTFSYPPAEAAGAWRERSRTGCLSPRSSAGHCRYPDWKPTVVRIHREKQAATVHRWSCPPWVTTEYKSSLKLVKGESLVLGGLSATDWMLQGWMLSTLLGAAPPTSLSWHTHHPTTTPYMWNSTSLWRTFKFKQN